VHGRTTQLVILPGEDHGQCQANFEEKACCAMQCEYKNEL